MLSCLQFRLILVVAQKGDQSKPSTSSSGTTYDLQEDKEVKDSDADIPKVKCKK